MRGAITDRSRAPHSDNRSRSAPPTNVRSMTTVRVIGFRTDLGAPEAMSVRTSCVACTITERSNCARARVRAAAPIARARPGSVRIPVTAAASASGRRTGTR